MSVHASPSAEHAARDERHRFKRSCVSIRHSHGEWQLLPLGKSDLQVRITSATGDLVEALQPMEGPAAEPTRGLADLSESPRTSSWEQARTKAWTTWPVTSARTRATRIATAHGRGKVRARF